MMIANCKMGNTEIYNIPNDKFKTTVVDVTFIDSLSEERAYKNALLPEILRSGTENYKNSLEIEKRCLELYGAEISTSSEKNGEIQLIHFSLTMAEERFMGIDENLFDKAISLLLEIIYRPFTENGGFSKQIFEREKENFNDFIRSEFNDKRIYGLKKIRSIAFEGEPYAVSEYGKTEDGDCLDEKSIYDYYKNYFTKKLKVKIFCHSSYNAEKVRDIISKNGFYSEEKSNEYSLGFRPFKKRETVFGEEKFECAQSKLNICLKTETDPESEDSFACLMANAVLGVGVNSMLFKIVREKNSLAYYVSSSYIRSKGAIIINAGIDGAKREQAEKLIFEQVERLKKGDFTSDDLKCAKRQYREAFKSKGDSQYGTIDYEIGQSFYENSLSAEEYMEKTDKVTKKEVVNAAKKWVCDCIFLVNGSSGNMEDV